MVRGGFAPRKSSVTSCEAAEEISVFCPAGLQGQASISPQGRAGSNAGRKSVSGSSNDVQGKPACYSGGRYVGLECTIGKLRPQHVNEPSLMKLSIWTVNRRSVGYTANERETDHAWTNRAVCCRFIYSLHGWPNSRLIDQSIFWKDCKTGRAGGSSVRVAPFVKPTLRGMCSFIWIKRNDVLPRDDIKRHACANVFNRVVNNGLGNWSSICRNIESQRLRYGMTYFEPCALTLAKGISRDIRTRARGVRGLFGYSQSSSQNPNIDSSKNSTKNDQEESDHLKTKAPLVASAVLLIAGFVLIYN